MTIGSKIKSTTKFAAKVAVSVAVPPVGTALLAKDTYQAVKSVSKSKTASAAAAAAVTTYFTS